MTDYEGKAREIADFIGGDSTYKAPKDEIDFIVAIFRTISESTAAEMRERCALKLERSVEFVKSQAGTGEVSTLVAAFLYNEATAIRALPLHEGG